MGDVEEKIKELFKSCLNRFERVDYYRTNDKHRNDKITVQTKGLTENEIQNILENGFKLHRIDNSSVTFEVSGNTKWNAKYGEL